jgi:hypothetical protein
MNKVQQINSKGLETFTQVTTLCCVALLAWWAFSTPEGQEKSSFAPRPLTTCVMDKEGYLQGHVYGTLQIELDWRGKQMRCDGMHRPGGRGIRLVFDQHEQSPLLIVIGIADAELGSPVTESPANVTVIDQLNNNLFSTQEEPRCWTTFTEQLKLTGTTEELWRINGELYCASGLPQLAGSGSITLSDIEYSGLFKPGS